MTNVTIDDIRQNLNSIEQIFRLTGRLEVRLEIIGRMHQELKARTVPPETE